MSCSDQHATRADKFKQPLHRRVGRQIDPLARPTLLNFRFAGLDPLWTDDQLEWNADEVHGCELRAGALLAILIKDGNAGARKLGVKVLAGPIRVPVADLKIDQ